ncbi:MAG: DNA polymerase III subunit delta' C-terminal domain-containing protein, partial [Anaerolineaceae bacterium]
DVLLQACEGSATLVNLDKAEEIKQLAAQYKVDTCQQAVSSLMRTLDLLDQNINLRLALENLMLDLP